MTLCVIYGDLIPCQEIRMFIKGTIWTIVHKDCAQMFEIRTRYAPSVASIEAGVLNVLLSCT